MKSVKILGLLALIALLAVFVIFFKEYFSENPFLGLKGDLLKGFSDFQQSKGLDSLSVEAKKEKVVLKITAYSDYSLADSQGVVNDKIFVLNTMYREVVSPYPGALSNRVGCDEAYKPKAVSNKPFDYYRIFASDRMTYGVCSDNLIVYNSLLYFYYCEKKKLFYEVALFVPKEEPLKPWEELLPTIECE